MPAVVETRQLSKWYGPTAGVIDLDLRLQAGEVFGFIGPNGAGKTTTIRLLLDLIRPTSGQASIFGLPVRQSAVEIHARTGYLPANPQLFDRLTSEELFRWFGRLRHTYDEHYVNELVARFDLDPTRTIEDLSTGNRQKVGVIQAFMHRPELLILDEPTAGLDPLVRREFRDLVKEVRAGGATVFLSSHELAEVEDICDRVGIIVAGKLRSIETIADLRGAVRRHVRAIVAAVDGSTSQAAKKVAASFDHLAGVTNLRVRPDGAEANWIIDLDISGSIDRLVKELSNFSVVDIISEPLSLEGYFLEAYDGNGDASDAESQHVADVATQQEVQHAC